MFAALDLWQHQPDVLAELAKGRIRAKMPALREALKGRFGPQHAIIFGRILGHIDFLDASITDLSVEIETRLTRSFQQCTHCPRCPASNGGPWR